MFVRRRAISGGKVAVIIAVVAIIAIAGTYAAVSSTITPQTATTTAVTTATSVSTTTATSVSTSVLTSTSVSTAVSTSTSVSTAVSTVTTTSTATGPRKGGTVVAEQAVSPDTLDPAVGFTGAAEEAISQVYQPMVVFKGNTTQIVPFLAESYNVGSDGLTYNFQIRQGITFSNGDPVNAYVFWYSLYRSAILAQSPSYLITVAVNTTSVSADTLNKYAATTPPGDLLQIMQDPKNAITVTGQYSLRIHLATPFSPLLATLTQPQGDAVDPVVVSQNGGVADGKTNDWMTSHAVGTGPFLITNFQPGSVSVYERNPTYWGGAAGLQPTPLLDKVIVKVVPNALTRLQDVERGSAQIAYIDFSLAPQVAGQAGIYFPVLGPQLTLHWLAMDTVKAPLNNTLLRSAISHAINTTAVLKFYSGFATSFVGPIPKGVLGYNYNLQPYSLNVTLAKQLLAQAGYPNGVGLPTLTFMYPTDRPPANEVAQVIQANLADIGIKVSLQAVTTAVKFNTLGSLKGTDPTHPDLVYGTWEWFPDPWAFADWFVGPLDVGASNLAWYVHNDINKQLATADSIVDQHQRDLILQNVTQSVYNDVPYVWLAQFQNAYLQGVPVTSINIRGFYPSLQNIGLDFSSMYLVP